MIIMVTGGRDYDDPPAVKRALEEYAQLGNILISGGAWGADYLAEAYWHKQQLPFVVVPAAWDRSGPAAGHARNHQMIVGNAIAPYAHLVPDLVVAFPGGKGTKDATTRARDHGIEVLHAP